MKDELRFYAQDFIKNEQDRVAAVRLFPTIIQFKLALSQTIEVRQELTPQEKTATPAEVFDKADEEIHAWVLAGIEEAAEEATREGRPLPTPFTNEEIVSIVPVDPSLEDAETEEQRARLYLQADLDEARADGFSVVTDVSVDIEAESTGDIMDDDVEIVPAADEWDLVPDDTAIINPFDEKVKEDIKEDVISEERAKEIEDLNKIIELTSTYPMPSGTTADDEKKDGDVEMKDSTMSWKTVQTEGDAAMTSSRISSVSMVDDAEVIPMDTEDKKGTKDDAPREGEPAASADVAGQSSQAATPDPKADVVDLTVKDARVDKPAGKPAEKKMPKPEKQKAPETKAMPRPKAPRLSEQTDLALKKLQEATERKEQSVWLDPKDMTSRIPYEYVGQGRLRLIGTKLSYMLRGHAKARGAPSPDYDPLSLSYPKQPGRVCHGEWCQSGQFRGTRRR